MSFALLEGSSANVIAGVGNVFIGTSDSIPEPIAANFVGYTDGGKVWEYQPGITEYEVDQETIPVKDSLDKEDVILTLNLAEATIANLGNAISGADKSVPKQITIGGGTLTYVSILVEADAPGENLGTRQWMLPKVLATGNVTEARKKGDKVMYTVQFKARKPAAGQACVIKDVWDYTIDTGAVTVAANKDSLRLTGEGSAADALTTIDGSNITSGDEIVLSIADEDAAITVTHGTAAIVLDGGSNFVMNDLRDWLELSFDGSKFTEVSRFDASA